MPRCGTLHSLPLFPLIVITTPWFISRTIQVMSIIDIEGGLMPDGENKQETQDANENKDRIQQNWENNHTRINNFIEHISRQT